MNWLFSVPATTKRCKFSVANASAEFTVPTKITPGPLGSEKTKLTVLGSGFVDELPPTHDGQPGPTKTPDMKYLAVRVRCKGIPKYLNNEGDFHHWNLGWVGIVSDDGTYTPCLGAKINEKLWTSHSFNKKYGYENTTYESICLFEVPPQTKSFTILCLLAPAAEGTVGQPALEAVLDE